MQDDCEAGHFANAIQQIYFEGLPDHFVKLADAVLIAEGSSLPVHQAILAANSSFFGDIFLEARKQKLQQGELLQCPLVGDSLADVLVVLQYCYQACTIFSCNEDLESAEDACCLARFAHKYDMQPILEKCELFLISRVKVAGNDCTGLDIDALVTWTALADSCNMSELMAHCELAMAKSENEKLWQHSQICSGDTLSRACLLRILRAAQHHTAASEHRLSQVVTNRYNHFGFRPSCHVTVEDLISWQQIP